MVRVTPSRECESGISAPRFPVGASIQEERSWCGTFSWGSQSWLRAGFLSGSAGEAGHGGSPIFLWTAEISGGLRSPESRSGRHERGTIPCGNVSSATNRGRPGGSRAPLAPSRITSGSQANSLANRLATELGMWLVESVCATTCQARCRMRCTRSAFSRTSSLMRGNMPIKAPSLGLMLS